MARQESEERQRGLVSRSPLAFLAASGLIPKMVNGNPLVKFDRRGVFRGVKIVSESSLFSDTSGYSAWMAKTSMLISQGSDYSRFEVANMWRAFNNRELTTQFALDPVIESNMLTKRVVWGKEYQLHQMSPTIEVGDGWRMADIMVVPTGKEDINLDTHPTWTRGYSPLFFYHREMGLSQWSKVGDLTDSFAGGLFILNKASKINRGVHGGGLVDADGTTGGYQSRTSTFFDLVEGRLGGATFPEWGWKKFEPGKKVRTNAGLTADMIKNMKRVYVPFIKKAALTSTELATYFSENYNSGVGDKIGRENLKAFSQLVMSGWSGAMLDYFDRYFYSPAVDYMAGRRVSL